MAEKNQMSNLTKLMDQEIDGLKKTVDKLTSDQLIMKELYDIAPKEEDLKSTLFLVTKENYKQLRPAFKPFRAIQTVRKRLPQLRNAILENRKLKRELAESNKAFDLLKVEFEKVRKSRRNWGHA
ncbi:hypothetical protein [Leptospira andrefontaineae]|uniref:Uncharacterized protein n=1 Tax=Leptospira andrefontaineae TaxID=2484976 RepID=A0A4R9GX08_9LEPT|nr:hypothetical protein [Leptospira andrefontaineae]TGK36251.1 hypothetical protein EHO65_18280 [Leptospira andrefontaineae]